MKKDLTITDVADARDKIPDLEVIGNGDLFQLLCKASSKSQGWMKSCKAMETTGGCVVQVTTQQGDQIAESLTFVPGVYVLNDKNGGRRIG